VQQQWVAWQTSVEEGAAIARAVDESHTITQDTKAAVTTMCRCTLSPLVFLVLLVLLVLLGSTNYPPHHCRKTFIPAATTRVHCEVKYAAKTQPKLFGIHYSRTSINEDILQSINQDIIQMNPSINQDIIHSIKTSFKTIPGSTVSESIITSFIQSIE